MIKDRNIEIRIIDEAHLFYLSCGFEIGGLDTAIYENTKQADKSDIYFYKCNL